MDENFIAILALLIPIFICVVLPVLIVLIVAKWRTKIDDNRTAVLTKALENNTSMSAESLAEIFSRSTKSREEIRNLRLLRGCIFTFLGLAALIFTIIFSINLEFPYVPYFAGIVSGIFLAIGLAYLLVYFISKRSSKSE